MSNVPLSRRAALGFGAVGLVEPAGLVDRAALLPQSGDMLVFAEAPRFGYVIDVDELTLGGPPVSAWAMDPDRRVVRNRSCSGQILLVRLNAHGSGEADGVVAFSAICTHAGCAVSGWKAADGHLLCPCHGSVYDPGAGGRVLAGPAPRALPALPLRVDGGVLTVSAGFTDRIGGFTGRTD